MTSVDEVAGRYRTIQVGAHTVRMLLAKNPAGWQEALSMVNKDAAGVVIEISTEASGFRSIAGASLSLESARRIVEAHSGVFDVSCDGPGVRLRVVLP